MQRLPQQNIMGQVFDTLRRHAGMDVQNDEDLEASVLIAILHVQESNMYKAFKRLIKYATGNRNFRKMLFGRNILEKTKPQYEAPVSNRGNENTQPYEELLDF